MRPLALTLILAVAVAATPSIALAHSGGTDANGCHNDSSTGTRHCHNEGGGGGGGDDLDDSTKVTILLLVLGGTALITGVAIWAADDGSKGLSQHIEEAEDAPVRIGAWGSADGGGVGLSLGW